MKSIFFECPQCHVCQTLTNKGEDASVSFSCPNCNHPLVIRHLNESMLTQCPFCDNTELYQHKDFNKTLGIIIFLVGAILVPWTNALSLIVALLIDALLYPFCPWMQVCYNCENEMRGWEKNPHLDRFQHETKAGYEYGNRKKPIQGVI